MVVEKPLLQPFRQLFPTFLPTTLRVKIFFCRHNSYFLYRNYIMERQSHVSCLCSCLLLLLLCCCYFFSVLLSRTYVFLTNFSGFLSVSGPDRTIAPRPRHAHHCFLFTILCTATRKPGGGVMGGNRCCNSACFLATCVDALSKIVFQSKIRKINKERKRRCQLVRERENEKER